MIDRVQIKQEARAILRSARVSPWLFTLLLLVILSVLDGLDAYTSGSYVRALRQLYPDASLPSFLLRTPALSPALVTFIGILTTLVSTVLRAGNNLYHLGIRRGREMPYSTLADGFSIAGRVILLAILEAVFIALWSLLFVIPGIVAAYRYRFAILNLLEDPNLSPLDAIGMSKEQTYGFKLDLFILDLSFLGWAILSGLTLGILSIWVSPYMTQTDVGYFQAVKAAKGIGARPEGEEPPSQPW